MRRLFLFLLLISRVLADSRTDLIKLLADLNGQEPVRAGVVFEYSNRTGEDKAPVIEEAKIRMQTEDGPQGLRIFWDRDLIRTAAGEMSAKTENPEKLTPTRRALEEFHPTDLAEYLNAAPALRRILAHAELTEEKPTNWQGRPARLLVFKLTPPLASRERKFIKEVIGTAKIWVGTDGYPLAAERLMRFKGRAMLVITFDLTDAETFEFARVGQRLVTLHHVEENHSSGAGEKGQRKTTTSLTLDAP